MNQKSEVEVAAGYMIANPEGEIIVAGRTREAVLATVKAPVEEGTLEPAGRYTIYPCDADIKDYFRLKYPDRIRWGDIDFIDGIGCFRFKRRPRPLEPNVGKTMSTHPHFYYRVRSITDGRGMAGFLDKLIDDYLAHHPELLMPEE